MAARFGNREKCVSLLCFLFVALFCWELTSPTANREAKAWHPDIAAGAPRAENSWEIDSVSENSIVVETQDNFAAGKSEEVDKEYDFEIETNPFDGDVFNLQPVSYRLVQLTGVVNATRSHCSEQSDECVVYEKLLEQLNRYETKETGAKLYILPVDPLAWMKAAGSQEYPKFMQQLTAQWNAEETYIKYKGSDHVFVCLTKSCQTFGADLARKLAGKKGTRAIFAGVMLDAASLEWPCPHRVMQIESRLVEDPEELVAETIRRASYMINKHNRWVCADEDHPANYFGSHHRKMSSSGIYVEEFGFLMCQIPKSGSTMMMMMLRRLMHEKDWNSTAGGLPHNPAKSGVKYVKNDRDFLLMKAIYDDTSIVKATVVRHPATRLLSGYLDKIVTKKEYGRVANLKNYVRVHGVPSFPQFVNHLVKNHPNRKNMDQHFLPQSAKCGLRDHRFDFVGRLDALGVEFKEFAESVGIWEKYGSTGWGYDGQKAFGEKSYQHNVFKAANKFWDHYTEAVLMKVYKYYKEDFLRFGFTLEEILKTKSKQEESKKAPA